MCEANTFQLPLAIFDVLCVCVLISVRMLIKVQSVHHIIVIIILQKTWMKRLIFMNIHPHQTMLGEQLKGAVCIFGAAGQTHRAKEKYCLQTDFPKHF